MDVKQFGDPSRKDGAGQFADSVLNTEKCVPQLLTVDMKSFICRYVHQCEDKSSIGNTLR